MFISTYLCLNLTVCTSNKWKKDENCFPFLDCFPFHLGVSKNRGNTPKMDGCFIMENPINPWMISGENPRFSGYHPFHCSQQLFSKKNMRRDCPWCPVVKPWQRLSKLLTRLSVSGKWEASKIPVRNGFSGFLAPQNGWVFNNNGRPLWINDKWMIWVENPLFSETSIWINDSKHRAFCIWTSFL